MPDDQDYADLDDDAARARLLRDGQARSAADDDQRDRGRVSAMWRVVQQLDEALAGYDAAR